MPTGADFSSLTMDPPVTLPPTTPEWPDWSQVPMYLPKGTGTQADPYIPMPGYSPFNVPARAGRYYIQPQAPSGWYRHPAGHLYAWHIPWYWDGQATRVAPIIGTMLGGSPERPFPDLETMWAVQSAVASQATEWVAPVTLYPGAYFVHLGEVMFLEWLPQAVRDSRGIIRTPSPYGGPADVVLPSLTPVEEAVPFYGGAG